MTCIITNLSIGSTVNGWCYYAMSIRISKYVMLIFNLLANLSIQILLCDVDVYFVSLTNGLWYAIPQLSVKGDCYYTL